MATLKNNNPDTMGLNQEKLKGRTQQRFFSIDESANLTYHHSFDVDFNKSETIDAGDMTVREINRTIRELMEKGVGNITVNNPEVTSKSYPGFWSDLSITKFKISNF